MAHVSHKIAFVLLCALAPAMLSCKRTASSEVLTEEQIEAKKQRNLAGLRLGDMLNDRDFERALQYLDTLYQNYPRDPQFYFMEGWVHDMRGDNLLARAAYKKSVAIYDSLIAAKSDFGDMYNRVYIIQRLYGMEAYSQALDEMLPFCSSHYDSMVVERMRNDVFEIEELNFAGLREQKENWILQGNMDKAKEWE